MPRRLSHLSVDADRTANPLLGTPPGEQVRTLLAEAQALSTRLAALNEVAVAMQSDLDTTEILHTFAREARWVIDFKICSFTLRTQNGYTVQSLRGQADVPPVAYPLGRDAISRVLVQGQALLLVDAGADDALPEGMQSAILLPLRHAGRVIGTINFYTPTPHAYRLDDVRIAYALAVQAGVILHNARLFDEVSQARNELHTILESIRDAVLVITLNGTVLLTNRSLRQMLKLGNAAHTGQHATALIHHMRNQPQRLMNANLLRCFRQQWRDATGGQIQLNDGRVIEWAIAPLHEQGSTVGYVCTARDISERIELEQFRDTMIGMLVHDLRTPLTSLMLSLDLLVMDIANTPGADALEIAHYSRASATRLMTLITTILDVRKLQAGKMELTTSLVLIAQLFKQATTVVQATLERNSQQVAYEIDASLTLVAADSSLLLRVIENLLGNALKFSPNGSTITLGAHCTTSDMLEISVTDCGPGIPDAQREHIFALFGQVRGNQPQQGTGMGLTFCKLVIEAHGGTIGVRKRPGGGSVFWCTLPCGVSALVALEQNTESRN